MVPVAAALPPTLTVIPALVFETEFSVREKFSLDSSATSPATWIVAVPED
jgi:hypothetical protein